MLEEQRRKEDFRDKAKNYEKVKNILIYLAFFGACIFAPKAVKIFKPILKDKDYSSWKSFNLRYLKWTLSRLSKQKMVDIKEENGDKVVIITEKGKKNIFKYALNDLKIPKLIKWDGKWRIVLYDIATRKRLSTERIRNNLLHLGFIMIQESVYIFPYPCEREIELLRTYYALNQEIKLITACKIEDEESYKTYFGLDRNV
ncbi:CRISPR-associated endonuclease Cas2 [Candidatus Gottesmanbacteria bacterium]|nr:CRISPR-associated endonuclease Cas2 [Candidatus Gottesmanbacteria bacterium]